MTPLLVARQSQAFREENTQHMDNEHETPEWLREPGLAGRSRPTGKGGPESLPLSGQSSDSRFNLRQKVVQGQAEPVESDERELTTLAALDKLLPHLGLGSYRPRLEWQEQSLTGKQTEFLKGIGIDPAGINRGLGAKILDYFRSRREHGLASFKQLKALIGLDVPGAESIDFETAKRLLGENYHQQQRGGPSL
jgi:hypothetical protein